MSHAIESEITGFPTHAARADWLIRCPDFHIVGYVASIRRALELAHFPEAVTYLDTRHAGLMATRAADGTLPNQYLTALYVHQGEMRDAALRRDGGKDG